MEDIYSVIFEHLPVEYCVRFQIVCKKWRQLLTSQRLWKKKCAQYWPTYPLHDITDYLKLFLERGGAYFITSFEQLRRIYKEENASNNVPNIPHLTVHLPSVMNMTFKIQKSNGLTVLFTHSYIDKDDEIFGDENNPNMENYWNRLRRTIDPHPNVIMPVRQFRRDDIMYTLHESIVENSAWQYILSASSGEFTEKKIARLVKDMLQGVKYLSEHGLNLFLDPPNMIYDAKGDWIEFKLFDYGHSVVRRSFPRGNPLRTLENCNLIDQPARAEAANIWNIGAFLYYFLLGINPYPDLAPIKAYMAIMREGVVFPVDDETHEGTQDEYDDYSAELKDLVLKMYVYEPEERIRVADALNHPWIQNPPNNCLPRLRGRLRKAYAKYSYPDAGSGLLEFGDVMDD